MLRGDAIAQDLPAGASVSGSTLSEAWRRFPGALPLQLVSILKPGDN